MYKLLGLNSELIVELIVAGVAVEATDSGTLAAALSWVRVPVWHVNYITSVQLDL